MKNMIVQILATAAALFLLFATAWGQVTVPNTFSAGTSAKAAEVNANFSALAAAIDGLGGTSQTEVAGYYFGHGPGETPADRNVILLKSTDSGTGETKYYAWANFQNCTVEVDGTTTTTFAYCKEYPFVVVDSGGTILSVSGNRNGSADPFGVNVRTAYGDSRPYDTSGIPLAITAQTYSKEIQIQPTTRYFNVLNPTVLIYFYSSSDTSPARMRDRSRMYVQYPGSLTLNGITYSDVAVALEPGIARRRMYAKGIGPIYLDDDSSNHGGSRVEDVFTLIYARIDGTEYGLSNLTGTPFDPGTGLLDGVFF